MPVSQAPTQPTSILVQKPKEGVEGSAMSNQGDLRNALANGRKDQAK